MGLGDLRLVGPPRGLDSPAARGLAYGAWDVLDRAIVAPSLRDAVSGSTLVVATSARDDASAWTPRRLAASADERSRGGRLSVVFGPEASGLTTEEISLCHERVRIPTAPEHSSLNLAQAVLLIAYEMFLSFTPAEPVPETPATAGELEVCFDALRYALLEVGFLNPANPSAILSELRRLIARSSPSPREVSLLRGLARQIAWAGEIARRTGRTR